MSQNNLQIVCLQKWNMQSSLTEWLSYAVLIYTHLRFPPLSAPLDRPAAAGGKAGYPQHRLATTRDELQSEQRCEVQQIWCCGGDITEVKL